MLAAVHGSAAASASCWCHSALVSAYSTSPWSSPSIRSGHGWRKVRTNRMPAFSITRQEPRVAELGLVEVGTLGWAEVEPANELAGGLLDGRPEPIAGEPLVIGEKGRQRLISDFLAWRWPPAGDVAHHVGIAVQLFEIIQVSSSESAQDQAVGLQEDVHRSVLYSACPVDDPSRN